MEPIFVNSSILVANLVERLSKARSSPPSLFLDLEGHNLSRHGTLSLLTLLILPEKDVFLVDVRTLGREAFSTAGASGETLKSILESSTIEKVIFDVRNDSDALFSHFQIKLAGVHDLQLMELATRTFSKRCVNGLAKSIENDAGMNSAQRKTWKAAKEKGINLFAPERGGTYTVFDSRPLAEDIKSYCVQDVLYLPALWSAYDRRLTAPWREEVEKETRARIESSQSTSFNGKGQHMALGPRHWPALILPKSTRVLQLTALQSGSTAAATQQGPTSENRPKPEPSEAAKILGSPGVRNFLSPLEEFYDNNPPNDDLDDELQDFTACSADDCGYCGRCMY